MSLKLENIKKLMGWCPVCKKAAQQTKQSYIFKNMIPISGKTDRLQEFKTSNVVFPANYTILLIYFLISLRLILSLRDPEYRPIFLVSLLLLNISCYWLILKTFDATVMIDKLGVHLRAFRLKELKIPFKEIKSVTSHRLEKRSKKESIFLEITGTAFCVFLLVGMAAKGEWYDFLLFISLLLLILLVVKKQRTRFEDLNTQLYIRMKHKKWYEWTSHYSLITDETSAVAIKCSVEKYCEVVCNAKAHEVRQRINLENFYSDISNGARGVNIDLMNHGKLWRVSTHISLFGIFLTLVLLFIYYQKGLEPVYLLTGLFMVLVEFVFSWDKQMQRYDTIAKSPTFHRLPEIRSFRGFLAIINLLLRISAFFLFFVTLLPYVFNFSAPSISGLLSILWFFTWGFYLPLIYWEKKNHIKIYARYENSFEKTFIFVKMYAIGEKEGER